MDNLSSRVHQGPTLSRVKTNMLEVKSVSSPKVHDSKSTEQGSQKSNFQ